MLADQDHLVVKKLRVYMSANMPMRVFYWGIDDINAYEMEESKSSLKRAVKFNQLVHLASIQAGIDVSHLVDWDGQLLCSA
jgi:hypothetical protein